MKWEYRTLVGYLLQDDKLNNLGADGWELVAVIPETGHGVREYIFKRPRVEATP